MGTVSSHIRRLERRPFRAGARELDSNCASALCVKSLASCTSGWSNGWTPMIAPARAVANSQRKISPPMSDTLSISYVMAGWPVSVIRCTNRVASDPSSSARVRQMNSRSSPYVDGSASGSPTTGTIPTPSLPRLSAISCSVHSPNGSSDGDVMSVSLSRPARASAPMTAPSQAPGLSAMSREGSCPMLSAHEDWICAARSSSV